MSLQKLAKASLINPGKFKANNGKVEINQRLEELEIRRKFGNADLIDTKL